MVIKNLLLLLVLSIELFIFGIHAVCGNHGIRVMNCMSAKNALLQQDIVNLRDEVKSLDQDIADWLRYPFFKEQYAREHLQMAKSNDEIFLL